MKLESKIWLLQWVGGFQYTCFFLICVSTLLIQVFSCGLKFLSVPTYISSYITDQNKASTNMTKSCSSS